MKQKKRRILLKLTGNIFLDKQTGNFTLDIFKSLVSQIEQLQDTHLFGIVMGGGNVIRGKKDARNFQLSLTTSHSIGMLGTVINGLIMQDVLMQGGIACRLMSAIPCATIVAAISQEAIEKSFAKGELILFCGGTGNPFFTTDTAAVLRSLQMQADEIWKGTAVDGIYTADPAKETSAQFMKTITYNYAIEHHLQIMDLTAYTLAQENNQKIRVFNIFTQHSLIAAAQSPDFGSSIIN